METKMKIESDEIIKLFDGTYDGIMSGCTVEILLDNKLKNYIPSNYIVGNKYTFATKIGIKGINIPVTVNVINNKAIVTTK